MNALDRAVFQSDLVSFLAEDLEAIVGKLARSKPSTTQEQIAAWEEQVRILKPVLGGLSGWIFIEFDIPRMGRRIDVVVISRNRPAPGFQLFDFVMRQNVANPLVTSVTLFSDFGWMDSWQPLRRD